MTLPTSETPAATVAICTRNRRDALQRAVRSLCAAGPAAPRGAAPSVELLVIDSASDDGTADWLAAALPRLPLAARSRRESEPGIGRARNRALAEARAPLLLFLDDDCTAAPGWLAAHLAAFDDAAVVGTGGRILPSLPPETAAWIRPLYSARHGGPGGRFDFGAAPLDLPATPAGDLPFGANCGLRVAAARAVGGFDERLGWGAPANLPGEESDLMERLAAQGGRLRYLPDALVHHHLPAGATTPERYLAYYRAIARQQARRERAAGRRRHRRATLLYRALRLAMQARLAALLGRRAEALALRRRALFTRARLEDPAALDGNWMSK